jgi:hypothetical protein
MAVFWVVAPCSPVEVYQSFRGPCCLHHQGASSICMKYENNPMLVMIYIIKYIKELSVPIHVKIESEANMKPT